MSNTYERTSQFVPDVGPLIRAKRKFSREWIADAKARTEKRNELLKALESAGYDAVESKHAAALRDDPQKACSRAEAHARGKEQQAAINEAINTLARENKAFIIELVEDCAKIVADEAERLAARDDLENAAYGLPPLESGLVCALRTRVRSLRTLAESLTAAQHDQGGVLDIAANELQLSIE